MSTEKGFNIALNKRYRVPFIKNGAVYKKGDVVEMNLALASKFYAQGKIAPTNEMMEDAKKYGCEELFTKKIK